MATATRSPNLESVTTINDDGSRNFLHPADVSGRFTTWRRISAYLLIAFFVLLPWIPINGYPAAFFDVAHQRIHLFGLTFGFADLWLMYFAITGLGFSLFFITALFGRIWCGWTCPQTVYLEHVFRRVERWIEGDATARRKLDKAPWTPAKIRKRVLKLSIFFLLSTLIAHIVLSYVVSLPVLYDMMFSAPTEHWTAFMFIAIATTILFFNFTWFREQLCIVICPYGRFQSALIDDDSMIIGYDYNRGEPRGKPSKEDVGDCIDCHRCVTVCPTGIDIRNGLQMECIGCANCIDACDAIMDKLGRDRGLIRYTSTKSLEGSKPSLIRPRTIAYAALLVVGATVAAFSASTVKPASATVTRMVTAPYFVDADMIRNQFNITIESTANRVMDITIDAIADNPAMTVTGNEATITLQPMASATRPLILAVPKNTFTGTFEVAIQIGEKDGFTIEKDVSFLGPDPRLLRPADE